MTAAPRKSRIFDRLAAGDKPRAIADAERVCLQYVYGIGVDSGLRRRAIAPTPGQRAWNRISAMLDRFNAERGRVRVRSGRAE